MANFTNAMSDPTQQIPQIASSDLKLRPSNDVGDNTSLAVYAPAATHLAATSPKK